MRVAFLAHSYHLQHTKSSSFFIEMLKGAFDDVSVIPHELAWHEIPRSRWDLLIIWQKLYRPEELEAFNVPRTTIIPMWDDCPKEGAFWQQYGSFRFLSFSSNLHSLLTECGLRSLSARWVPPAFPDHRAAFSDGLRGFFWPRTTELGWKTIWGLMGSSSFEAFHLHLSTNLTKYDGAMPAPADRPGMRLEVSDWFQDPADYLKAVKQCNVFFSPRKIEGIGVSFLEAMALGMCVVSANAPTMNEYVQDGANGILYDPDNPKSLDFSHAKDLGEAARQTIDEASQRWTASVPEIMDFLCAPNSDFRRRGHPFLVAKRRLAATARALVGKQ